MKEGLFLLGNLHIPILFFYFLGGDFYSFSKPPDKVCRNTILIVNLAREQI